MTDPVNSKPRVTKAKRYDELGRELAALLDWWDRSTNPVLLSAAGQLREAIGKAEQAAYRPRTDWEQRQYEEAMTR